MAVTRVTETQGRYREYEPEVTVEFRRGNITNFEYLTIEEAIELYVQLDNFIMWNG